MSNQIKSRKSHNVMLSERRLNSLDDLRVFAKEVSQHLPSRAIVLLNGPMGVGKTQFTKFLLEELGSDEAVSPSYALHNSYSTSRGDVEHLDLYRLESADDLESTGFWDLFESNQRLVIIEWPDRLTEFGVIQDLPRNWPKISITLTFDGNTQARSARAELN